jgi:surface protein
MGWMFYDCKSLTNLDISNFNTSNVIEMSAVFYGCSSLESLDMSSFDMQSISDLYGGGGECFLLLDGCSSLTTIYTPYNVGWEIELPSSGDTWYLSDGTVVTAIPQNLSSSVVIGKNHVPTENNSGDNDTGNDQTEPTAPGNDQIEPAVPGNDQTEPAVPGNDQTAPADTAGSDATDGSGTAGTSGAAAATPSEGSTASAGGGSATVDTGAAAADSGASTEASTEDATDKKTSSSKTRLTTKNTTIKLSKKSYIYNGKAKKPTVKVYNSKGKVLKSKYYTVTYKNNTKVGKAIVTIKFKGKYTGTIKATYTIKPKATTLTGTSAKSDRVTLTWKKQTKQISGYQIQYATDSKFTKNKTTVLVKGAKKSSETITGLSGKTKYYFRIRTYKTVDGKKYYSAWSKAQAVKTK